MYRKFECVICGYIYDEELGDPEDGIPPGTKWEDIPDDWVCPECGVSKFDFEPLDSLLQKLINIRLTNNVTFFIKRFS